MKTIYKYQLDLVDKQPIYLPRWAKFLHIDKQWCLNGNMDKITLWFEIDTEKCHTAIFYVVGTGREVPDNAKYLGTVIIRDYVWHVYSAVENQIRIPQYGSI